MPAWLRLMRPLQWTKNGVVLAGVVFSGNLHQLDIVERSLLAFVAFCLVSSGMYTFNDWHDREEDRRHPVKRRRPIASGEVAADRAIGMAIALLGAGLLIAAMVSWREAMVVFSYSLLMICYTLWFREIVFLDVLVIAIGFVLRALAGTVAAGVSISVWLFVCTLLLALTLGLGKRWAELSQLQQPFPHRRPSLDGYERVNVSRLVLMSGVATILAYLMYTLAVPTYGRSVSMALSAPFVAVAVGRYLWLVIRQHRGSAPERLIFEDRWLAFAVAAWGVAVAIVLTS
jgi:4-hydroxybenzoate polyprenyltransferase